MLYNFLVSSQLLILLLRRWSTLDITTEEVKSNLEDLKVLGKGDFKVLMNWRKALREEVNCFLRDPIQ